VLAGYFLMFAFAMFGPMLRLDHVAHKSR